MNELEREGSDLKNFILGSGSPRRRELLAELLTDFRVVVSDAEEMVSHPDGPIQLVQENATLKARSVANLHRR